MTIEMQDAVSDLEAHRDVPFATDDLEFDFEFVPVNLTYERDLPYLSSGWRPSLGPELWKSDRCWISCDWEW